MADQRLQKYIQNVLENMPGDWLNLTTHRLDIYNESLAKTEFLEHFDALYQGENSNPKELNELPTAYDYIRLGHPLSCILEWTIAKLNEVEPQHVISFSSQTMPIMAVLRKNAFEGKKTLIAHVADLPADFDAAIVREVYGYTFELEQVSSISEIPEFDGSVVFVSQQDNLCRLDLRPGIDFFLSCHPDLGSVIVGNGEENQQYSSEIQHVRRRESIAMTPTNCLATLQTLVGLPAPTHAENQESNRNLVLSTIQDIVGLKTQALVGSSGLSIQYGIMMGLIHDARENHPSKEIKFLVPLNCYGGTNDQARRVAAAIEDVEVIDLPVDGGFDMAQQIELILDQLAQEDAVPYIIAEIPTNPRVEVPDLDQLREALTKKRTTGNKLPAVEPVFILDQTFCPNVQFLSNDGVFTSVKTISYASGSKFPSAGRCTAGYCVVNKQAEPLMEVIANHLRICDNEATPQQMEVLAEQLSTMNQRIEDAYKNTCKFVEFISQKLPDAKINFVSKKLAKQGFTPSVFSIDLPTKGDSDEERETYKRSLNYKLINMMIKEIPTESKFCVSYGQLKGCYWAIPATSTQGTTQEDHKDYITRAALSPDMDLERHKKVFSDFVDSLQEEPVLEAQA